MVSFQKKMIPKIIHRVWLWNNTMPTIFQNWENRLYKLHTNWEFFLWDDKNIRKLKNFKEELYKKLQNYSEKSDYLRYISILEYGGIYLDTDMEPLCSFDSLLNDNFFIGKEITLNNNITLNGAFYGASKNNLILKELVKELENRILSCNEQTSSAVKIWPRFITPLLINKKGVRIYDADVFHPIPWWHKNSSYKQFLTRNTMVIHHFSSSWKPRWLTILDIIKIQSKLIIWKLKKHFGWSQQH